MNAFDIETYTNRDKNFVPYCISYKIDDKLYCKYINNLEDNLIEQTINDIFLFKKKKINFYVHNLDFDGLLILSFLTKTKNLYKYEAFTRDTSFYVLEIKQIFTSHKIVFLCSYKIFPLSLKKIAIDFTDYKKLPFPYLFSNEKNIFYCGKIPSIEYWNNSDDYNLFLSFKKKIFDFKNYSIEYCQNDVLITAQFIFNLQKIIFEFDIKIEDVYSGPSLALKIFIKKFNKNKISFSNTKIYDDFCRSSYYGGRCEVYGNPNNDEYIFHYDFSGMYAQCMMEKFAYGSYIIKNSLYKIDKPGFYWIIFDSDLEIPILPIHNKKNGKLMFVNGKNLSGCYWFEEIFLFLEMGGKIKNILYSIEYEKYDYVFNDYATFFTKMREKGGAYSSFGKNMNNFLYGRMGLSEPNSHSFFIEKNELNHYLYWKSWEILSLKEINNIFMVTVELTNEIKKKFNIEKKKKFKKNVSIASAITSKARIKLYKAQQSVLKNEGRLLYSDTDSIFAAYKKNVLNEKHGDIFWDEKKENTIIKDAVFVCAKTYGLILNNKEEIIKIKGFNSKEINFEELKTNFYEEKIIHKNINIIKKDNFTMKLENINKILNLNYYDKRIFIENKKKTKPIFF